MATTAATTQPHLQRASGAVAMECYTSSRYCWRCAATGNVTSSATVIVHARIGTLELRGCAQHQAAPSTRALGCCCKDNTIVYARYWGACHTEWTGAAHGHGTTHARNNSRIIDSNSAIHAVSTWLDAHSTPQLHTAPPNTRRSGIKYTLQPS